MNRLKLEAQADVFGKVRRG